MRDLNADLQALLDTADDGLFVVTQEDKDRRRARLEALVAQVRLVAHSYDELYALLKDPNADVEARRTACDLLRNFAEEQQYGERTFVDKRRASFALLAVAKSEDEDLSCSAMGTLGRLGAKRAYPLLYEIAFKADSSGMREVAMSALGHLGDKRAVTPLVVVAKDKAKGRWERTFAIWALWSLDAKDASLDLMSIIQDESDDLEVRAEAAETLSRFGDERTLPGYIKLLNDPRPEMRFWAAFGLVTLSESLDISAALLPIDKLTAYDASIAEGWWHVGREALPALGGLWYVTRGDCEGIEIYWCTDSYLISPLLEYSDYQGSSRQSYSEDGWQPLEQSTTLRLDPAWLSDQLKQQWRDVRFNVIEPQPESLLLNWEIDMPNGLLLCGLHRDGYSIMLTNRSHWEIDTPNGLLLDGLHRDGWSTVLTNRSQNDVFDFAIWYRSIISPEHTLRLYKWAGYGREILPGMTVDELKAEPMY